MQWLDNNRLLSQGIDPKGYHLDQARVTAEKNINTFGAVSRQWEAWQAQTTSKSTITGNKRYPDYARAHLDNTPIADITPSMILTACKEWENKGDFETAKRIKIKCSQVFRYAASQDLCTYDPTTMLKGVLSNAPVQHRAGITDPKQFGQLVRNIENLNTSLDVIHAIKLLALLYPRNGDLRKAKWSDFDFNHAQ